MSDRERGLYMKYEVRRLNDQAGKHRECEYYVLDLVHDRHAAPALLSYADSCEAEFPDLARDLRAKAAGISNAVPRFQTRAYLPSFDGTGLRGDEPIPEADTKLPIHTILVGAQPLDSTPFDESEWREITTALRELSTVLGNPGLIAEGDQTIESELVRFAVARLKAPAENTPLDPTKEMIEAGAQRLVRWEEGSKWPDSWSSMDVRASRNDAERVWRSMWLAAREGTGRTVTEGPFCDKCGQDWDCAGRLAEALNKPEVNDKSTDYRAPLTPQRKTSSPAVAHTNHPLRHFDRTCPACLSEDRAELVRHWRTAFAPSSNERAAADIIEQLEHQLVEARGDAEVWRSAHDQQRRRAEKAETASSAAGRSSTPALTFDAFRRANVARCLKWHPAGIASWSPSDWLTAVTGELGELASLLKMRNRERDGLPGNKFSPSLKQIADEVADVLTYLDLLAEVLGVDLGRAAVEKFNEVSERVGFPDRISVALSVESRGAKA